MLQGANKKKAALALLALSSIAAIVAFWLTQSSPTRNFSQSNLPPGTLEKLQWHATPKKVVPVSFKNHKNQEISLTDFLGTPILLNFWATWCAPCIAEMPALDQLQSSFSAQTFAVIALSLDRGGLEDIDPFWEEAQISALEKYFSASMSVTQALGVRGIPTTLLIDKNGRELARLEGPADWGNPETIKYLRTIILPD